MMNELFKNEPEQRDSHISLTTCSSPLLHVSTNIDQSFALQEADNKENCIKFVQNEYEDFYLRNYDYAHFNQYNFSDIQTPPEFTDYTLFNFSQQTANMYYNDDIQVLDYDERIIQQCTATPSCDTPFAFVNTVDSLHLNYRRYSYKYNAMKVSKPNYAAMDIANILKLKLSLAELTGNNLIYRLMKDEIGCRHLQNLIKSAQSRNAVQTLISSLINNLVSNNIDLTVMSEDIYGSCLIQLFFSYGNDIHHEVLFNYFVYKSILNLSKTKYGCRVVQEILASVNNPSKLVTLIHCFQRQATFSGKNKIYECLFCGHSKHVIQAMIELKLPFETVRFIADALESNLLSYSENVYACQVIQSLIRNYGDKLNVNKLFVNDSHLLLSQCKYGNSVIQCIIAKHQWYSNLALINQFRNQFVDDVFSKSNIVFLSKDKHGSNVIETCIKVANEKQMDNLINTITEEKCFLLQQIISDRFGNDVPKIILNYSNKRQQHVLVDTTHQYIVNLYNHYHEYRQCAEYIHMCQQIKYRMH